MTEKLWVGEHGRIFEGTENQTLENGNLELKKGDFRALMTLLDDSESDSPDFEPIFKYSQPHNEPRLTVQNYVGIIRTDRGTQIEILPKVAKREQGESQSARRLLIKMLLELQDSPFKEGTSADLEAYNMPLFELLLRHFMDQVVHIVRKGIARTYVPHKDNLLFLKGKLCLTQHIKLNVTNAARCYCEYDEYEANRPINRLIKGALEIASKLVNEPTNQQRCRELMYWFEEVPSTVDHALDFQRMQKDRLIQHYSPAMPSCRMILENLNPLTREGERRAISMLFPMERVFEDYVAARLPYQFNDWSVSAQVHGNSLVEKHKGRKKFALIPDLSLKKGSIYIIADTKWKLLNSSASDRNYDISQSDIYQLYAYLKKYLTDQKSKEVILIYPKTDSFKEPLDPFWYDPKTDSKETLYVVPYDLETDTLQLPSGCSLSQAAMLEAV